MMGLFTVPSLLQLSAERVASDVNKDKRIHPLLKRIQLPNVNITYLHETEHYLIYKTCDFDTFIKEKIEKLKILSVIPSVAKGRESNKLTITVGSEKLLYVATVSDLGYAMLKLDWPEGKYELFPFEDGYVLSTKDYSPKIQDAQRVFNNLDGDKGLAGIYPQRCKESDENHLRIVNEYITERLNRRWWHRYTEVPFRTVFFNFPHYCINIPVLFYLTEHIDVDDLSEITLICPTEVTNLGNVQVYWYVQHSIKGRLGIAVQQTKLFGLMKRYIYPGVCLFASHGYRAIGNFDHRHHPDIRNAEVFERHHPYRCEFDPCFCTHTRKLTSGPLSD